MQRKTVLTTVIAVAGIAAFGAGNAYCAGTDFVWDGGGADNDWRNEDNWNHDNGYPNSADDTAVIDPASATQVDLNLNSGSVTVGELTLGELATLTVTFTSGNNSLIITRVGDEDGVLTIQDDSTNEGVLNIGNDSGAGGRVQFNSSLSNPHQIGGVIRLPDEDSELRIVSGSDGGAAFDPYMSETGEIDMLDASASILIEEPKSGDKALVSNILFHGMGTIDDVPATSGTGTATFVNEYLVFADADGGGSSAVLAFGANLLLDDMSGAVWGADSDPDAWLEFNEEATGLAGDFDVQNGATLRFNQSVTTSGAFDAGSACGTVDTTTDSNVCFEAGLFQECDVDELTGGC